MIQNFIQFNGFYGCCSCEQPGKTVQTTNGGHVHTFPYLKDSPKGPARTKEACLQYAVEAVAQHSVVCVGISLKAFDSSSLVLPLLQLYVCIVNILQLCYVIQCTLCLYSIHYIGNWSQGTILALLLELL